MATLALYADPSHLAWLARVTSLGGPERGLERARKQGIERSSMIAYGGWGALSLLLMIGTMTTLGQAELTERSAVLDRADAGAAALEQTMLRVFEQVAVLQSLAQTRVRMIEDGNTQGQLATEQELQALAPPMRFGILRVSIVGQDGTSAWNAPPPVASGPPNAGIPSAGTDSAGKAAPAMAAAPPAPAVVPEAPVTISTPQIDPATNRWVVEVRRALLDQSGKVTGYAVAVLDPLVLSTLIASQGFSPGERSLVQLRDGGAIIARSHNPVAAITERISQHDPALVQSLSQLTGKFRDRTGTTDRLVGFRAPRAVPIVVSHAAGHPSSARGFLRSAARRPGRHAGTDRGRAVRDKAGAGQFPAARTLVRTGSAGPR